MSLGQRLLEATLCGDTGELKRILKGQPALVNSTAGVVVCDLVRSFKSSAMNATAFMNGVHSAKGEFKP